MASVSARHDEGGTDAACRADGAEEVGALIALVGGLARSRPTPGPLADEPVLLADAGFILEPDLDRLAFGDVGHVRPQRDGEVCLKAATVPASWVG